MLHQPLVRSQHLSWFSKGDAVLLYHDLYGFLLEMSADIHDFAASFAQPQTTAEAQERFQGTFVPQQVEQFAGVLIQHRVLVPPQGPAGPTDELAGLYDAVPLKGPWIVVHSPERGAVTAVTSRGFGTEPYAQPVVTRLDDWEGELWRRIDGEQPLRKIASALTDLFDSDPAEDLQRAARTIAAWTHHDRQLTRVLLQPRSQLARLPTYASSTMPYPPYRGPVAAGEAGSDLSAYHEEVIADAEQQFEELETTLSHLFCEPSPALHGRTYAQTLTKIAVERGWLTPERARVVEVGGGTGRVAAGILATLRETEPALFTNVDYTIVDLSPALRQAQQERLREFADKARTVAGHAERLDLPDNSVDLLLANEMIADLRIGHVTRADLSAGAPGPQSDAEAFGLVQQYGLSTQRAPEPIPIQVGATRLLERIAQVLRPGGTAVLTEFGELEQFPIASDHLDHAEHSVHFGHLRHVAEKLGLEASVEKVPDLLGMRGDVWVLGTTRTQFRNLRHLLQTFGIDLKKRALTPEQLSILCAGKLRPDRIELLQFRPVAERVMGLRPDEFKALVLRKPPSN